MSLLRPTTGRLSLALRSSRVATTTTTTPPPPARFFSATTRRRGGGAGKDESPYEPPTGWLWGVKPGEKYQNEGWEGLMFYMYIPACILMGIAYCFKPETSVNAWALEEARRRLEAEGILEDPFPDHKLPIDEYTSTREGKHPPV